MPLTITRTKPRQKEYLTKGGLRREDSDDELGYDDHPWKWIREDDDVDGSEDQKTPSKKRKASALDGEKRAIIGARMGSFIVRIGDPVLLKSPEEGRTGSDWPAISPRRTKRKRRRSAYTFSGSVRLKN